MHNLCASPHKNLIYISHENLICMPHDTLCAHDKYVLHNFDISYNYLCRCNYYYYTFEATDIILHLLLAGSTDIILHLLLAGSVHC